VTIGSRLRCALRTAALLGAALGVLGVPRLARGAEPEAGEVAVDEPAGESPGTAMVRYPPSSVRVALIAGGLGMTAAVYAAGMISGFVWSDVPGADALKVPVVGPWIALGQSGCPPDEDTCAGMLALRTILTTLDGLVQLGGLGIAAEGIFMTTEGDAEASPGAASSGQAAAPPALQLGVAPMVGPSVAGVSVTGRF
jgi:hypothetical protein